MDHKSGRIIDMKFVDDERVMAIWCNKDGMSKCQWNENLILIHACRILPRLILVQTSS